MLTATDPAAWLLGPRSDASPTCMSGVVVVRRAAQAAAQQFRPSGAALYARPSGMRAGLRVSTGAGPAALSRRIPKQHAAARVSWYSPAGAGTPMTKENQRTRTGAAAET
jgi:hypothetical protein